MLQLNRDVYEGEEILLHYDYSSFELEVIQSTISWLEEQDDSEPEEEVLEFPDPAAAAAAQVSEEEVTPVIYSSTSY